MNIKEYEEWRDGNDLPLCKECFGNETKVQLNKDTLNYKCVSCKNDTIKRIDNYCSNCGRKIIWKKK